MDAMRLCGTARSTLLIDAPLGPPCGPSDAMRRPPEVAGVSRGTARGVIFDTADVLYDATLWPRRLLRLVSGLGVSAGSADFLGPWQRDYLADVDCGRRDYAEAFQSFLLAAGLTWAQIDEVEAASRMERTNLEFNVRPWPGVVKTIARLSELGLPLVAWADLPLPAAKLIEHLGRLGLADVFRATLTSFDLEAAQPASRRYLAALDALGQSAVDVLYVGHDALHLAGARAIGLRTAAFNFEPQARADLYLTQFEDLLALLDANPAQRSLAQSASGLSHSTPQENRR